MTSSHSARRGWPPVIAHAIVAGVTQIYWLTYSPVATDAARAYDVSSGQITLLANVYPILYFILAIPIGWLLDRNPRPTLLMGATLTGLGGLVRALDSSSFALGLTGQVLVSIAQPVLLNGLVVVAHQHLEPEQRPAGIALGSVGFFVGIFIGFTSPVLLVDGSDLSALLWFQAALGVAGAAFMAWTVRHPIHTAAEIAGTHGLAALKTVVREPGIRVIAVISLGGFGVFGALMTVLQPLLEPRGISSDQADLLVDGLVLAGLVVAAFAPAWASRTGRERPLLIGGLIAASAATGLAAIDLPLGVLAAALAVAGGLLVPALPIVLEISERLVPDLAGTASAVIWLSANLGVGLMTALAQAFSGTPSVSFAVLAAGGLATAAYAFGRLQPAVIRPSAPHEPADLVAASAKL